MGMRFHELLRKHLEAKGYTFYWLQENIDIPTSLSTLWKTPKNKGGRRPSIRDIEKLANCKELGLSKDTLLGWRASDEYSLPQLLEAIRAFEAL